MVLTRPDNVRLRLRRHAAHGLGGGGVHACGGFVGTLARAGPLKQSWKPESAYAPRLVRRIL